MEYDLVEYLLSNYSDFANNELLMRLDFIFKEDRIRNYFHKLNTEDNVRPDRMVRTWIEELGVDENYDFMTDQDQFELKKLVAESILKNGEGKIKINRCPICKRLARTPSAKQGPCGHKWSNYMKLA